MPIKKRFCWGTFTEVCTSRSCCCCFFCCRHHFPWHDKLTLLRNIKRSVTLKKFVRLVGVVVVSVVVVIIFLDTTNLPC